MITILIIIIATALIVQVLVGLSFFISSIWEQEKRASWFSDFQLFGMIFLVIIFFYLYSNEFYSTICTVCFLFHGIFLRRIAMPHLLNATRLFNRVLKCTI
jgi:hypothetical protein